MLRYLPYLLIIGLAWSRACWCGALTQKTGKMELGKFETRCGNNHISWTKSTNSVYQGGRGMAFEGRKGNSVNSNDAKLKKEELKQTD